MATAQTQLDPKSYVARVIEELEANPDARALLLRALLTDEFLEVPTRLERVEKTQAEHGEILAEHGEILTSLVEGQEELREGQGELREGQGELREGQRGLEQGYEELREGQRGLEQGYEDLREGQRGLEQGYEDLREGQRGLEQGYEDLREGQRGLEQGYEELREGQRGLEQGYGELREGQGELREGQRAVERRVSNLERDVSILKGDSLEWKLFKRIRPLVSQMMNLRRSRIMLSGIVEIKPEIEIPLMEAVENGVITQSQELRVTVTDFVIRAVRNEDGSQFWIAVEVSNNIAQRDIERVKESADALNAVFGDAVGVVAGYRIHPRDRERADESGVRILLVEEDFWME